MVATRSGPGRHLLQGGLGEGQIAELALHPAECLTAVDQCAPDPARHTASPDFYAWLRHLPRSLPRPALLSLPVASSRFVPGAGELQVCDLYRYLLAATGVRAGCLRKGCVRQRYGHRLCCPVRGSLPAPGPRTRCPALAACATPGERARCTDLRRQPSRG